MKLTLENVGKIKHAEIDLSKDLIVLCGPNNTGKTYAAYSVYGLFRGDRDRVSLAKLIKLNILKFPSATFKFDLIEIFRENVKEISVAIEQHLLAQLPQVFATRSMQFSDAKICVNFEENLIEERILKLERQLSVKSSVGVLDCRKRVGEPILTIQPGFVAEAKEMNIPQAVYETLIAVSKNYLLESIFDDAFIAPAERIAINIFNKELAERRIKLVDELLDSPEGIDSMELVRSQASRYSIPVRDNIAIANRLDVIQNEVSSFSPLANDIERDILYGKLSIGEYGEVVFTPKNSKTSLDIHLAGSVVKSLASIVFYLRHQARSGDFYIIDEPELTLHPDNQRKMARILARMVNAGIKVMMSTHSDYIIRELNNLMMLKTDHNPEKVTELMEKYGYKEDELVDHNRVGAYLFTEYVTPLEVNETGFEVKTIDDEIHSMNNSSSDIFFSLHD